MPNFFSRFLMLAKRWWWLVVLGVFLCGGTTYGISKLTRPVYRATANILLSFETTTSSSDNLNASLAAAQSYAQLMTNPTILNQVVALHPGLTLPQLNSMITVTPKPSTAILEVDVDSDNPTVAMQLANEICASFQTYAANNLTATVNIFPAVRPTDPLRPHATQYGVFGALVGLGLSIALIFAFEWFDDRLSGPEEIPELLGMDAVAVIPQLSRRQRQDKQEQASALAEACRMLCASLNAAQRIRSFKLVMVSSALAGEGKSIVVSHLASFLALTGKRVLVVDADLRRPVQFQRFQLDNSLGLSRALEQVNTQISIESQIQATDIPTLYVLTAGIPTANSAELLQSPLANQLFDYFNKAPYDYVLFDTPPLLPVADSQFLASLIHATVLVIDVSKTPRKIVLRTKRVFDRTYTTIIGVALNKSTWPEFGYIREYQRNVRPLRPLALSMDSAADTSIQSAPTAETETTTILQKSSIGDNLANSNPSDVAPVIEVDINTDMPETSPMGSEEDPTATIRLPRHVSQQLEEG
jgi:capsular exopolysaccharide synthesis family protein